jgi:hypothetical protein
MMGVWEGVLKGIRDDSASSNLKSLVQLRQYTASVAAQEKSH